MSSSTSKEFIVHSLGEDSYVEVQENDTLEEVRKLISLELDVEQLPDGGNFCFKVNGIRISTKQERRKAAFDLLAQNAKVELIPRNNSHDSAKRKLNEESESLSVSSSFKEEYLHPSLKRFKKQPPDQSFITPSEEHNHNPPPHAQGSTHSINLKPAPFVLNTKLSETREHPQQQHTSSLPQKDHREDQVEGLSSSQASFADAVAAAAAALEEDLEGESNDHDAILKDDGDKQDYKNETVNVFSDTSLPSNDNDDNDMEDSKPAAIPKDDDEDDVNDNDDDEELQVTTKTNPHEKAEMAKTKSLNVLSQIKTLLAENPLFCHETRRQEWEKEILELEQRKTPQTIFGVLGNTGVGKSSLLNALLDEAAVLPTSGSRGCTAAVVELVFHSDLVQDNTIEENDDEDATRVKMIPAYEGEVEFITLDDWHKELKILLDECSTAEKTIYAIVPMEDGAAAAFAAWQKIEQVYGRGYMEQFHKQRTDHVLVRIMNNPRVRRLLTVATPGKEYNSIRVEIGQVAQGSQEAKELLKPFAQMKARTKRQKKKWAQDFRKEINSYVYRKGNGEQPQTWPLIRKVRIRGPWPVLSTGAVLVDLPGVRDSNAARAKVAEKYLQHCNQIAIVAPIKRAVDDGTAKELLGEQFKRRLLMDGQYGNVFFICTQTDDLEATETMRDHADVAQKTAGRWEKMSELANSISDLEKQINDTLQDEEDLETRVQEAKQQYLDSKDDLKEALKDKKERDADDENELDAEVLEALRAVLATNKTTLEKARKTLEDWKNEHQQGIDSNQEKCSKLQKKLKTLCAGVRNEYSKACLQEDFRSGLKDLYRKNDDDNGNANANTQVALPEEFNMDVFCISSNDYLKLMKIKPSRDGPPNTFINPRDTLIPQLRSFVHETTARLGALPAKSFVENTSDLLDRMKLLANDSENVPTGRLAYRMKSSFEMEMTKLDPKIQEIAENFKKVLDQQINQTLTRSLQTGAKKGSEVAMSTVNSWGSANRRTKHERRLDKNGLHYATYNAVVRRSGVFTSSSAGAVDLNQELCDPMEKEFSTDWQSMLDTTIKRLLSDAEKTILKLRNDVIQSLASNFRHSGVDGTRLSSMVNAANRSTITALRASFQQIGSTAMDAQRDLSRTLLPAVQQQMQTTYASALNVQRGTGTFSRMKGAMASNSQLVIDGMFDDAMQKLLTGIKDVIQRLQILIAATATTISKTMESVFSICWDDQSGKTDLMDPVMRESVRKCRDKLLPDLTKLCEIQNNASVLLGIERTEVELDVMAVETLDQCLKRKLEAAKKSGDAFDLCDSDEEVPVVPKVPKVKAEKGRKAAPSQPSASMSPTMEIIDLCDSDDEEESSFRPSGTSSIPPSVPLMKQEPR